ncbi:MAG: cupin domain-containing protein [Rhizobiales bacterium]|jgi:transcriptional regulator with XRE-family HTH domain|nr:cupin domain-containing protein [Hyphomicrobiales bacterium]
MSIATDGSYASYLGAKLKLARLARGLSLRELSTKAGITEGHLSKIENNRAHPSLASLHQLAGVLGLNMSALFAAAEHGNSLIFVVRSGERPKLHTGHRRANNHIILEKLVPSGPEQLLQVNIHVIAPKGGSEKTIKHLGQEFGFVLEGIVELNVDDEKEVLSQGDSFFFNSDLPHRYTNTSDSVARVLWVNTPPTF